MHAGNTRTHRYVDACKRLRAPIGSLFFDLAADRIDVRSYGIGDRGATCLAEGDYTGRVRQ